MPYRTVPISSQERDIFSNRKIIQAEGTPQHVSIKPSAQNRVQAKFGLDFLGLCPFGLNKYKQIALSLFSMAKAS